MKHLVGGEVGTTGSLMPAYYLQAPYLCKPRVNMCVSRLDLGEAQRKGKKTTLVKHPLCSGAEYILADFNSNHLT